MANPSLFEETCKMIRSVLLPNKSGLFLCNLEREFRGVCGESIQWRRLGFRSLKDLIMNIPEVVRTEKLGGDGQLLLHATPDSSTQHIANMVSKQRDSVSGYNVSNTRQLQKYKQRPQSTNSSAPSHFQWVNTSPTLPPQLIQDLSLLLSAFPQGLLASDLLREYRKIYGRELNLSGFSSIIELCSYLPNVVHLQKSGPYVLLLPAAPKVSMKIADLNNKRELETLLKKFDCLFKKRLQHSRKESGRLVTMLRGWCKQLEDEGDLQEHHELNGDLQQHPEIGRDQQQYEGFGRDHQKLLEEFRDQRQRLEAERNRQQLMEAEEGCQQHLEASGNDQYIVEREIYKRQDSNYEEEEEEDDHQVEAAREEGSSPDEAVICVERMSVKIDASTEVTLHCIQFNGDTSTMWCSSQEIAHLIPVWGGRDLLAKMLVVKNVVVEQKILHPNTNGQIMRELVKLGVKGVAGENEVSLYKLDNVKYFVRLFTNHG